MLVNLPKVTQLARRRPGVYKGHAFVCYVLSWFPSLGFLEHCLLRQKSRISGGPQMYSQGLWECFLPLEHLYFAWISETLAWRMVLTCRELPLRPEQVWMGISGASTELVITCIAKDTGPLANHSSAFAKDVLERDGSGFQASREETCKLPSGKYQGQ